MSAPDEFDPFIERLYARQAPMPDADAFAAGVEQRLARGSRIRTVVLTAAGLIGGVVAVRETVASNFAFRAGEAVESGVRVIDGGATGVADQGQAALAGGLDQLGFGGVDLSALGSMGGASLFWVAAAALIALAGFATMKLADQV